MKVGSYIYTNSYAPADTNQLWVKPMSNGEAILYIFVDGKWTPTGGVGESAYEAAVKAGFNGSKEEWLDSLALKYSDLTAEQKADLVKDAVSAAERAAQAVENIENTINDIDVSSTDGAITALAAKQGTLENKIDVLGPKIDKVDGKIDELAGGVALLEATIQSGYYDSSLEHISEAYGTCCIIDVTEGDKYRLVFKNNAARITAFADNNGNVLSTLSNNNGTETEYEAPLGAKKLYISSIVPSLGGVDIVAKHVAERKYTNRRDVGDYGKNISMVDGELLFVADEVAVGDSFSYYITIGTPSGYYAAVSLYSSDGTRIAIYGKIPQLETATVYEGKFVVPQGFAYARVQTNSSDATLVYLRKGNHNDVLCEELKSKGNANANNYTTNYPKSSFISGISTLTPNSAYTINGYTLTDSVPFIKALVLDSGQNLFTKFKVYVASIDGNSVSILTSSQVSVNSNGNGYVIINPNIKWDASYAGAYLFLMPLTRSVTYESTTGYSAYYFSSSDKSTLLTSTSWLPQFAFLSWGQNSIEPLIARYTTGVEVQDEKSLADIVADGGTIYLKGGTYIIGSTISVPSNTHIIGDAKTVIKPSFDGPTFLVDNKDNVIFERITFVGQDNAYIKPSSVAANDFKSKTGIGNRIGISFANKSNAAVVSNCTFKNFDNCGIYFSNDTSETSTNREGVKVDNCFFHYCYIGVWFGHRYEYSHISNSTMNDCYIGIWIDGGNNIVVGCHFDQNYMGMMLSGQLSANEGHCVVSSSTFNHCDYFPLYIDSVRNGEVFDGIAIHQSSVVVENSSGIIFSSSILAPSSFSFIGGARSNICAVYCNRFYKGYGFSAFENDDNVPLILKNNFFSDGSDSNVINN